MNTLNIGTKQNGDPLDAQEFNNIVSKINELVGSANNGGGSGGEPIDTTGVITVSSKGNTTLGSTKNVNIEPAWNTNAAQNY